MEPYWGATCAILVPGVLLASWTDYAQRRVPNWLNATLILCGFAMQGIFHGGAGLVSGLLGLLVGFGVLIVPWMMHGMGAGDVKLMAAIGVWFGPWMTLISFCVGGIIGGIVAVIMIVGSGRIRHAWANMGTIVVKMSSRNTMFGEFGSAKSFGSTSQLLPYGVPLTVGSLIVLAGQVFHWWAL
ncbi:MAG: prepilin peptidase [Phycisphaerales bacterium]|nr:MAG: prepilin peptidase [Phycisphaerales bacterium]